MKEKEIIIEVEAGVNGGIEEELIKLGEKCDMDLEHLPLKEFQINIIPSKELEKEIENELIAEEVEKRIALMPTSPDMLKRTAIFNEIRKQIRAGKEKLNKLLTCLDVDFLDEKLILKNKYCFEATLSINKKKFNMQDSDLDIRIEDIELFRNGREEAVLSELKDNVNLTFGILAFMQTTKKEVQPTRRKVNSNKPKNNVKSSKKKNKGNKKTYLYNKVYKINKNTLEDATSLASNIPSSERSKRTYHISSWYQRGHWRNYKNGKSVWIEAQFKHPRNISKEDDTKKTYKITRI